LNLKSQDEIANFQNFVQNEINELNTKINESFEKDDHKDVFEKLKVLKFNIRLLSQINEKTNLH